MSDVSEESQSIETVTYVNKDGRVCRRDSVGILCRSKPKPLTFFEKPLNMGLVSGGSALAGLTVVPVLLKVFKFF